MNTSEKTLDAASDRLLTQLQETGECLAGDLTVAEVVTMLNTLGIDPQTVRFRFGWIEVIR